jgi:hypothetical protein
LHKLLRHIVRNCKTNYTYNFILHS